MKNSNSDQQQRLPELDNCECHTCGQRYFDYQVEAREAAIKKEISMYLEDIRNFYPSIEDHKSFAKIQHILDQLDGGKE